MGQRGTVMQNDGAHHLIFGQVRGDREDHHLGNAGMGGQNLLDLVGGDVLAPSPDRVLHAVEEAVIAVPGADQPVTGMQPQIAPGLDRLFRHPEIAERHGERFIGTDHQLSGLAIGQRVVGLVHDYGLEPVQQLAHPARLDRFHGRADHGIAFGSPVSVQQHHAGAPGKGLGGGGGHAGGKGHADGMGALVFGLGTGQQHRHHGTEHIGHGGARPRHGRPEPRDRKARLDHLPAAMQERLEEAVERIGMEKRQRRVQRIAPPETQHMPGIDAPPEELRMRADDALGRSGGARGIKDGQRAVGTKRRRLGLGP